METHKYACVVPGGLSNQLRDGQQVSLVHESFTSFMDESRSNGHLPESITTLDYDWLCPAHRYRFVTRDVPDSILKRSRARIDPKYFWLRRTAARAYRYAHPVAKEWPVAMAIIMV